MNIVQKNSFSESLGTSIDESMGELDQRLEKIDGQIEKLDAEIEKANKGNIISAIKIKIIEKNLKKEEKKILQTYQNLTKKIDTALIQEIDRKMEAGLEKLNTCCRFLEKNIDTIDIMMRIGLFTLSAYLITRVSAAGVEMGKRA